MMLMMQLFVDYLLIINTAHKKVYVYKSYQKLYTYFLVVLMKENESDRDGHAGPR